MNYTEVNFKFKNNVFDLLNQRYQKKYISKDIYVRTIEVLENTKDEVHKGYMLKNDNTLFYSGEYDGINRIYDNNVIDIV